MQDKGINMGHNLFTLVKFLCIAIIILAGLPSSKNNNISAVEKNIHKKEAPKYFLRDLERLAKKEMSAKLAVKLYEEIDGVYDLSSLEKKEYEIKLKYWKQYAAKDYVRNGSKWIPRNDYIESQKEADKLINQALELVKVDNWKFAEKKFKSASKLDQNAIRSDFTLGLFYSPLIFTDIKKASKHFRTVLKRDPNNISALNNLALTEMRLGNHTSALKQWRQAVAIAPKIPEVTHNLGKLISEASIKTVYIKPSVLEKYTTLYSDAIVSGHGTKTDLKKGWLYLPLVLPRKEEERVVVIDDKISKLIALGSGSGFVIAPNYILTNRHVIKDEKDGPFDVIKIIDPEDPIHQRELNATTVAICENHDLAIIRCDRLKAPAIPLSKSLPRRGSDIMILGYPLGDILGRIVKSSRGSITALPQEDPKSYAYNRLLYDATSNPGNSGGPVCDNKGNIIAVHSIGTLRLDAQVDKYAGGIPSTMALPFVKKSIPNTQIPNEFNKEMDWPDVDEKVSPSTVMIFSYTKNSSLGFIPASKRKGNKFYEENLCLSCNGTKKRKCYNCTRGRMTTFVQSQTVLGSGNMKQVLNRNLRKKSRCNVCNGSGRLRCKHCR
jgi:S1-C subfamily serine protease